MIPESTKLEVIPADYAAIFHELATLLGIDVSAALPVTIWDREMLPLLRQLRAPPFQQRVQPWLMTCFGEMIAGDREERNHRFLEEALELVQAAGCTASEVHQLIDYVFGRPSGEPAQEVGGVMVTLAALCLANDLDMHAAAEVELDRIWTKVDAIRAKQAAKPKHSPLPGYAGVPTPAEQRVTMIAAYDGPVVSFDVAADYYLASCDACGWVGSSEKCGSDEADDVFCPRCMTAGADCGAVANRANATGCEPAAEERVLSDDRIRQIAADVYLEVADEPLGDLSQRRSTVQRRWYDAVRAALLHARSCDEHRA